MGTYTASAMEVPSAPQNRKIARHCAKGDNRRVSTIVTLALLVIDAPGDVILKGC
jgi:hypothetical protein